MKYFPPAVINNALRVIYHESKGDPIAVGINTNGTIDVGLFQMNSGHRYGLHKWHDFPEYTVAEWRSLMIQPEENVRMAHFIWEEAGGRFSGDWVTARAHRIP
jgi:hypothetical protein